MAFSFRTVLMGAGFIALGAATSVSLDASARRGGHGEGMHERGSGHRGGRLPGGGLARAMGELDLTVDQEVALESLRADAEADRQVPRGEGRSGRGDLVEQLASGALSRDEMHDRIDARAASRTERAHASLDRILDVYETLTPEQLAELAMVIEENQARRAERAQRFEESGESGGRRGRGEGRGGGGRGGGGRGPSRPWMHVVTPVVGCCRIAMPSRSSLSAATTEGGGVRGQRAPAGVLRRCFA